ncbi:MAG: hypothetical protein RLZ87_425 [Armatimonadota bacterium]|jgi:hypothetical protein
MNKVVFLVALVASAQSVFSQSTLQSPFDETFYKLGLGNRGRGSFAFGVKSGNIGFQFGVFNNLDIASDQLSVFPPTLDAKFFGNYRTEPGFGVDLLYFFGEKDQSFYVGLGLYNEKISEVWRSPSTDELFDIGGRNQVSAAYSIGFTGKFNERSQFGFGYHTMLGWNVTYSIKHRK